MVSNSRRLQVTLSVFLSIGVLWALGDSLGAQRAKVAPVTKSSGLSGSVPSVWKSQTTGHEYRVRADKERFYAEWINQPAAQAKHKAYIRSEAFRSGSKWVGVSRSFLPCATDVRSAVNNWCHLVTRIEIDSMSSDKITGRGDTLKNFDCHTCRILETGWRDFVWIPKNGDAAPRGAAGKRSFSPLPK